MYCLTHLCHMLCTCSALHPDMRKDWAESWARLVAPGGELLTLIFPVGSGELGGWVVQNSQQTGSQPTQCSIVEGVILQHSWLVDATVLSFGDPCLSGRATELNRLSTAAATTVVVLQAQPVFAGTWMLPILCLVMLLCVCVPVFKAGLNSWRSWSALMAALPPRPLSFCCPFLLCPLPFHASLLPSSCCLAFLLSCGPWRSLVCLNHFATVAWFRFYRQPTLAGVTGAVPAAVAASRCVVCRRLGSSQAGMARTARMCQMSSCLFSCACRVGVH